MGKNQYVLYEHRPITPEVIEEFQEEPRVAEWMHERAELIKRAVDTDIRDDPTASVSDLWRLLTITHRAYSKKYGRYKKTPSKGSSKRFSRKSHGSSRKGRSSRHRAPVRIIDIKFQHFVTRWVVFGIEILLALQVQVLQRIGNTHTSDGMPDVA